MASTLSIEPPPQALAKHTIATAGCSRVSKESCNRVDLSSRPIPALTAAVHCWHLSCSHWVLLVKVPGNVDEKPAPDTQALALSMNQTWKADLGVALIPWNGIYAYA